VKLEEGAMMRFAGLLVAFFVLTLAAIAYAECAWVLWTEERNGDGGPPKLWVTDAFSSREECRTRVEYMTALIGRGLGGRAVGNIVVMSNKDGKPSLVFAYHCLPDTVDPREPERR
jgi:hypothetical protein